MNNIYYVLKRKDLFGKEDVEAVVEPMYYNDAVEFAKKMNKDSSKTGLTFSVEVCSKFVTENYKNVDSLDYIPY